MSVPFQIAAPSFVQERETQSTPAMLEKELINKSPPSAEAEEIGALQWNFQEARLENNR